MTKFKDLPVEIQDRMLKEHTSIRYNLDVSISPVFQKKDKLLREFKEEWNKSMMAACNPPSPILNSVKYYEDQIEKWTKEADKLRGEIKELETKSTWDKEEVRKLMKDSFYKGIMAEAFSLPIDFDADKWIEEEINKTIKR